MSDDLFAAFGEAATSRQWSRPSTDSQANSKDSASVPLGQETLVIDTPGTATEADLEDDFGDFEDASRDSSSNAMSTHARDHDVSKTKHAGPSATKPTQIASTKTGRHPFADHMDILFGADQDDYDAGVDELDDLSTNPEAAMAYSKQLIAAQAAERDRSQPQVQATTEKSLPERKPSPSLPASTTRGTKGRRNMDVLFDTEDPVSEDDGDFGDFELGGEAGSPNTGRAFERSVMPALDLLRLDDANLPSQRGATTNLEQGGRQAPALRERPVQSKAPIAIQHDDPWEDFETAATPPPPASQPKTSSLSTTTKPPRSTTQPAASNPPDTLPPTNIPPPASLLSIFPSIFASAQDALFAPLAKLDSKQRQVLAAHPATHQFLRGYLSTAIVLGHIIAGRRLRWKRDQYLAQGMRIGPAGKGGGMKLAGVDKSEVAKEDREVLDAVRLWKAQVGKLRGAVTTAGATSSSRTARLPAVPDIAEQMPVKALKAVEGGFVAPQACALCGLRREERVAKVDVDVDDSFGEWWVQGVSMHVVCKGFWDEHNGKLKSR